MSKEKENIQANSHAPLAGVSHSPYRHVIIESAPITERYWTKGDKGVIDERSNQIAVGGAWFNFDERWIVKDCG